MVGEAVVEVWCCGGCVMWLVEVVEVGGEVEEEVEMALAFLFSLIWR